MPTRLGTRCLLVSAADVGAGSGSLITRSAEAKLMWIRPGPNRYWPQASSAPEKLGSCQYPSLCSSFRQDFLLLLHWEPRPETLEGGSKGPEPLTRALPVSLLMGTTTVARMSAPGEEPSVRESLSIWFFSS